MRKSHLIPALVLLWMLGIGAAAALLSSHHGTHPSAASSTSSDFSTNPNGAPARTVTLPDGSTRAADTPLSPSDNHAPKGVTPTPNELLGDQQATALNGLPALKAIPYTDSQISLSFVALEGKRAIINVRYRGSLAAAGTALRSFLARQHDSLAHYRPRFISKIEQLKQVDESQRVMLAMRGFTLLTFLPVQGQPFTVTLLGERGAKVALVVGYSGQLRAAKRAFAAYLTAHHDQLGHYLVSYRAHGR